MDILSCLKGFTNEISQGRIEIYNEASIQFELAVYLRCFLGNKYKVQLERNIDDFKLDKEYYQKKEMDIVIFTTDTNEKHCIELKYPTSGQVPEQMFSACKDLSKFKNIFPINYGDNPIKDRNLSSGSSRSQAINVSHNSVNVP